MDRRFFIGTAAMGLFTLPLFARAQQPRKIYRVGVLGPGVNPGSASFYVAFEQRLKELGWVDGQNIAVEFRTAKSPEDLPAVVADMVRQKFDVLVATGTDVSTKAAVEASKTIPIVMVALNFDPVEKGYVATLARPGGNITGVFVRNPEVGAKQLELLTQILPNATRIGVLWDTFAADQLPPIAAAGRQLRLDLQIIEVSPPYDFERAFETLRERRSGAVLVVGSPVSYRERDRIARLALRDHLPTVGGTAAAEAGNLMGFGFNLNDAFRRAAEYVDKILRGANPADLPIDQPNTFELVINMKTASTLGLKIPQSILLRADKLIQ